MFITFIRKYLYLLKKENLTTLIGFTLMMMVITSLSFYYFEVGQAHTSINNIYDSFWWSIVTFTTVGYGDIYPVTAGGKVVAIFAMIFGIGFVGTFMASIASIMIQARTKELRGMKKLSLKDHLIICGYNKQKVERFIMEFRSDVQFQDIPIVIVSDSIEYHPLQDMPHVHFIQGETTDEATLQKACIKYASKVIVIAESNQ
ncbi:MAG TPA: potassium channel protein, partial [Spirochaetes bacterium]|nr:potassium channel protein [Spirochaetota bacterium]